MENPYIQQNSEFAPKAKIRAILLLIATVCVFIGVIYWFYSHAFIKIAVENPGNNTLTYKLVNQKTHEVVSIDSKDRTYKKLVPRGDYEVLVLSDGKSYFEIASTKSFLRTTDIKAGVKSEKKREFVGDNPGPCSYYDQIILLSFSCDGKYGEASAHLPATVDSPTTTENDGDDYAHLSFGGIIKISGKKMAYVEGYLEADSKVQENRLLEVGEKLEPTSGLELPGVSPENTHNVQSYKDGFLIYSDDYSEIKYFASPSAAAEKIEIAAPKDSKLTPSSLSVSKNKIALVYSNEKQANESNPDSEDKSKGNTAVQVYESGKTKSFMFESGYSSIKLCGDKYLCYQNSKVLSIFNISNNKQKLAFKLTSVAAFESEGNTVIAVRDRDILGIDISSRKGAIHYSLGSYKVCGIQPAEPTGYTLCLINPKNNRAAMYINPAQSNTDNIDKKVLSILNQPYVSAVSVYKSFIYISPELGELEYDGSINGYVPNPEIKQKTNHDIDSLINELGINRSIYNVINVQQ